MLGKFVDNTKLEGAVDSPDGSVLAETLTNWRDVQSPIT